MPMSNGEPTGASARLRGMFAFALWDARSQTLLLARDRMGKKPLYVAEWGGRLYFGSEIRAVLACSNMAREVNVGGLRSFLDAGFLTSPHTMFKDIQKIPAAHFLLVRRGAQSLHRYWQVSFEADTTRQRERHDRALPRPPSRVRQAPTDERGPARRSPLRRDRFDHGRGGDARDAVSTCHNGVCRV